LRYRKFGKLNWMISALSYGAMRLPVVGSDRSKIDEKCPQQLPIRSLMTRAS
jgi:hypothetical protein